MFATAEGSVDQVRHLRFKLRVQEGFGGHFLLRFQKSWGLDLRARRRIMNSWFSTLPAQSGSMWKRKPGRLSLGEVLALQGHGTIANCVQDCLVEDRVDPLCARLRNKTGMMEELQRDRVLMMQKTFLPA